MLYEWALIVVAVLELIIVGILLPIIRGVFAIRRNDLSHVEGALADIKADLKRIEEKQDRHLEWHASQKS